MFELYDERKIINKTISDLRNTFLAATSPSILTTVTVKNIFL